MLENKPPPVGTTVLLAESKDSLRTRIGTRLAWEGYQVIAAEGGKEAVQTAARHEHDIKLLLTDVVLPGFYGWHLAELLKLDYPQLKVIYVTSSSDRNAFALCWHSKVIQDSGWGDSMIATVREVLACSENGV